MVIVIAVVAGATIESPHILSLELVDSDLGNLLLELGILQSGFEIPGLVAEVDILSLEAASSVAGSL